MDSAATTAPDPVTTTVGLMRAAAQAIRSVTTGPADEVRAIHAAVNALQARQADLLAEMDATKAHEAEGAASIATWARRELGQDPGTTRQLVRAAKTMRDLPQVDAAARAGRISIDHVHAFTYGLKHVGHHDIDDLEDDLLAAAVDHTPNEVFAVMRCAKAIKHADQLDEAWLRGMDKEDIRCVRVGDGFQLTGFLGIDLGAKFKVFLDAVSVPRDGEDDRTNAERRVDGLDELLTKALGNKLKNTNTISAHVNVIVDADRLKNTLNNPVVEEPAQPASKPLDLDRQPATLTGFGPIGPALTAYIAFGGNLTYILVEGFKANRKVLDAERGQRIATAKQRRIIWFRQNGVCANRGCHHPIGEIHHIIDWLYGGRTNLNNLAGLCRKCHALITMGRLQMTGTFETGYTFTTVRTRPLARTG